MTTPPRRPRSDALQNRARLLEVAARAFAEEGLDAAPAAIARRAGVGVGTLYRHFPTREELVHAAYRHQLARACESVTDLVDRYPAAEATRAWTAHFLDYAAAKSGMSAALDAGARDGTLRTDLTPDVVLLFMGGVAYSVRHGTPAQAGPLVDLLMAALTKDAPARPVGEEG